MKKYLLICITALCCMACGESKTISVVVTNPLNIERTQEMVELSVASVVSQLELPDTALIVILDEKGNDVPYQITYDEKVIFPATVPAEGKAVYTIKQGTPKALEVIACGRQYPERLDDVAWENDLVGFRVYGPALQARGERGFGYDLFTKYNTTEPVLEDFYAKELNQEVRTHIEELKKSDAEAAKALAESISYHIDHGYGMDCYAVGPTLGAGIAALMTGDTIVYPWCYKEHEILDNGPLRFTVKLVFNPLTVKGDTAVIETRLISLDAGSYLNRTAVSFSNLKETLPIATGIVLHEPDGAVATNADQGYITYVDPTTGANNGKIMVGAAFPANVKEAKTVLFSEQEQKQRNNANGHVLALSDYEPGAEHVYYWGFAWSKAAIKTPEAWNEYMARFADKVRNPLTVTMKCCR